MKTEASQELPIIDLNEARNFLFGLTQEAGEILKTHFKSGNLSETGKGGLDFATQADTQVDAFLLEKLRAKYPDSNFLTEETAPDDFSTLAGAPNLWIIDPLDGTGNFSRSDPNFAISIGLLNKGTIHIGVVHKPMTSEIFHAQIDQDGAYLNGNLIQVSPTDSLAKSAIAVDWPHDLEKRSKTVGFIEKLNKHVRQVKIMGSAVSDLMKVATGSIDAYLQPGLKPWDVAAAGIIVEKAGGKITNPDGSIWNPFSGAIFASNGKLQNQILQLTRQY